MDTKLAQSSELIARSLKNKKILITAGPTWVPIDSVRVISNIATGETGILLAERLLQKGAKVTLLLGPAKYCCLNKKIRIVPFTFFEELKNLIARELKKRDFDIIIHSAAVSDFKPAGKFKGKLDSEKAQNLRLSPLPKLAGKIRELAPKSNLVLFKLESSVSDNILIERARITLRKYNADLIIANRIYPAYTAYILNGKRILKKVKSKQNLVKSLSGVLPLTPET